MDVTVCKRYSEGAHMASEWLIEHCLEDGSLQPTQTDLAAYYKIPLALFPHDIAKANMALQFCWQQFGTDAGLLQTSADYKSKDPFLTHFPHSIDAWLALSAQQMGSFDIAQDIFHALRRLYHPEIGGFMTFAPLGEGDNRIDLYTTTMCGLMCLYFGDLNKAKRAANMVARFLSIQPDIQHGFYLQLGVDERLMTNFVEEEKRYHIITTTEANQCDNILGLVLAFLAKMYLATHDESYLTSAKAYVRFVKICDEKVLTSWPTTYVAWGLALVGEICNDQQCLDMAMTIGDMMLDNFHQHLNKINEPSASDFELIADHAIAVHEFIASLSRISP